MDHITLRQLRYFEALALQGHFGHAAQVCSISQPALSVQIKELEEAMGHQLFERNARQVRLTSFGEDFALRVRDILQRVDELHDFARAGRGRLAGRFRLGVIPTVAPYLLPHLLGRLATSHPALDLHVRETTTPRLVQELQRGQLDTAIVALPLSERGLTEAPVFSENFVLVRPLAEEGRPVPTGEELRQMRLLLLEEGHCLRDQTLAFCSASSGVPRDGLDGSSLSTLVQMVGAGIGVTMIPEMAIAVETRSAPVCCTPFAPPRPGRQIGMVWRQSSPLTTAFEEIRGILSDVAHDLRHADGLPLSRL